MYLGSMTGHKLTPYDSADYLDGEAAIDAYLDAAKVEGGDDPAYMAHVQDVAARARSRIATTSIPSKTGRKLPIARKSSIS